MPFPNFIVIGAARCGTTSLHHYLGQHPQIFMCPVKEPNYFAFDGELGTLRGPGIGHLIENSVVNRNDYLALFRAVRDETAIGEVSPRYMIAEGCAARIRKNIPAVRLIAILRHPVERAWSGFIGHKKDGWESCEDFRSAFAAEPSRRAAGQSMGLHFAAGRYADQLEPYFGQFAREQIHVVLYEDLLANPASLVAGLFRFLDVDPDFEVDVSIRHNPSGEFRNRGLRWLWQHSEKFRRNVRGAIPEGLRNRAYRHVTRNLKRRELPPELRMEFTEYFREDIQRLSSLIDRNLDHWLAPPQ